LNAATAHGLWHHLFVAKKSKMNGAPGKQEKGLTHMMTKKGLLSYFPPTNVS
jgi:hypothetical protein